MEEVIIRAKRKGTENPFKEVEKVQLEGIDILYSVDALEFEDNLPTNLKINDPEEEKHWQEVREKAAIIAMQSLIRERYDATSGYLFTTSVAVDAVAYANALVEKLKSQQ